MSKEEAQGMLGGKDPFSAQGKIPAAKWQTPLARDGRSFKGAARSENAVGSDPLASQVSEIEGTTDGGINPEWAECLMGYPFGWTDTDFQPRQARNTTGSRPASQRRAPRTKAVA